MPACYVGIVKGTAAGAAVVGWGQAAVLRCLHCCVGIMKGPAAGAAVVGGRGRAGGARALPHGLLREGRRPLELHVPPRPRAARAGAVTLGPLAPRVWWQ